MATMEEGSVRQLAAPLEPGRCTMVSIRASPFSMALTAQVGLTEDLVSVPGPARSYKTFKRNMKETWYALSANQREKRVWFSRQFLNAKTV